jgi:hypothetical protein
MTDQPIKHHFNPAFSLKPWAGADNLVCEMRSINRKVSPRRCHPNATGFQKNLYKTEGVGLEKEQHLEVNFMKPLDTAAERALQKIMSGDMSPWEPELRKAWTIFILSLMYRNPAAVQEIKQHIADMWDAGVKSLEETYTEQRLPTDPATFAEYHAKMSPAAAQIGATNMMVEIISSQRVGPTIFNMHWGIVRVNKSRVSLLNSDRPIERPFGLHDPRAHISFPVGPQIIFIAANDARLGKRVGAADPTKLAKSMNKLIVAQAHEFVWGCDDSQIDFVRKHFGTAKIEPVISERARTESLAAARGKAIAKSA